MEGFEYISKSDFWYLVGFITADGNLSKDGRHLCIVCKDTDILIAIKNSFKIKAKIAKKYSGYSNEFVTFLQFGNAQLYRKLLNIGLTPNKSLTLRELKIPDAYFPDFLRGEIDGDGNIRRWIHPQNGCEQWELRIYSGAPIFSRWLYHAIQDHFQVKGILLEKTEHSIYRIKFGKTAAREILSKCYYKGALAMRRKEALARQCIASYRGWAKSFTVTRLARVA